MVPRARGVAARLLQEAAGYRQKIIDNAEGDASRFSQVLVEYQKSPVVTRERLYLDTMEHVMNRSSKIIVDQKGGNSLLYLPLDKLQQMVSPAPAIESQPSPSTSVAPAPITRSRDLLDRERGASPMNRIGPIVLAALVALLLLNSTLFTLDQRQTALVCQFGEVKQVYTEPGLKYKLPLVQNVLFFDRVFLPAMPGRRNVFSLRKRRTCWWIPLSSGGSSTPCSSTFRWGAMKIVLPRGFAQTVNDGLRAEFGKRTVHDVVSGQRDQIMKLIQQKADMDAREIGVEVVDVRLKRVDLSDDVSASVYGRMEAERKRDANEARSTGAAEAEKIRADADKQKDIIIAEAYREAERVKGEGDAKATATYAAAYGKNPEFYAFYRSMQAYRESFRTRATSWCWIPARISSNT